MSSCSTSTSTSNFLNLLLPLLLISITADAVKSSPATSTNLNSDSNPSISGSSSSTTLTLPIHKSNSNHKRSKTGEELKTWASKQRSHLRNKYNLNIKEKDDGNQKRDGESGAVLTSYESDSTYYTPITIGSDNQSFNVILDTGSADLWVAASSFTPTSSTSFNNLTTPFSVTYGSGSVSGYLATDSVTLASQSHSTQTFALATTIASGLTDDTLKGIMGLGFQSLASSNASPFWQNVDLDEDIFAFYLSRDVSSTISVGSEGGPEGGPSASPHAEGGPQGGLFPKRNDQELNNDDVKEKRNRNGNGNDRMINLKKKRQIVVDQGQVNGENSTFSAATSTTTTTSTSSSSSQGQFTLGGLNESLYTGDINYSDVLSKSYWLIPLLDLSINGTSIDLDGTSKSAIDTGTTLIGGPSKAVKALYASIGGSSELSDAQGYYQYPCSTNIDVSLTFGNKSYSIPNEDFLASYVDTSMEYCMGAIFDVGSAESDTLQWIVGDAFLKNVYSIYSNAGGNARVGFASLAQGLGSVTQSKTSSISSKSQTSDSKSFSENNLLSSKTLFSSLILSWFTWLLI